MKMRDLALQLLREADDQACSTQSFRAFHSPHLDYLNLVRSPGLTAKVYFIRGAEAGKPLVNPHDHAYDFHTTVLHGRLEHRLLKQSEWRNQSADKHTLYEWTPIINGLGGAKPKHTEKLSTHSSVPYGEGTNTCGRAVDMHDYTVRTGEIHTIAPLSRIVVLFLLQFADRVTPTRLWVPEGGSLLDTSTMYRPMSPNEFDDRRQLVLDLLG